MTRSSYGNWAITALGCLGLTYGLEQLFQGRLKATTIGAAALGAPLAITGMVGWTCSLLEEALG